MWIPAINRCSGKTAVLVLLAASVYATPTPQVDLLTKPTEIHHTLKPELERAENSASNPNSPKEIQPEPEPDPVQHEKSTRIDHKLVYTVNNGAAPLTQGLLHALNNNPTLLKHTLESLLRRIQILEERQKSPNQFTIGHTSTQPRPLQARVLTDRTTSDQSARAKRQETLPTPSQILPYPNSIRSLQQVRRPYTRGGKTNFGHLQHVPFNNLHSQQLPNNLQLPPRTSADKRRNRISKKRLQKLLHEQEEPKKSTTVRTPLTAPLFRFAASTGDFYKRNRGYINDGIETLSLLKELLGYH